MCVIKDLTDDEFFWICETIRDDLQTNGREYEGDKYVLNKYQIKKLLEKLDAQYSGYEYKKED